MAHHHTLISASELQQYILHRKNVDHLAPTSMRICYSGIRFFYLHVLERDWKLLDLIRAQSEYRLPAILSVQEARRLLSMATPLHNRVYFTTVYSLGLRLHEGLFLQVSESTANDSWSTCIGARGPRTAMSPSLQIP
jgi:integrase/recombinase XerD